MSQRGEDLAGLFQDFRDRIYGSQEIAWLMAFDARFDWSQDIGRAALFRKKDFDARACGFCRLDKDEFVFVGQDHRASSLSPATGRTTDK